jgi:hypothetical protein
MVGAADQAEVAALAAVAAVAVVAVVAVVAEWKADVVDLKPVVAFPDPAAASVLVVVTV